MTAGAAENAAAAAAMRQGEANAAAWADHAERLQATIEGSDVEVTDTARGPYDGAVDWPNGG